jgi:hypothetical protein
MKRGTFLSAALVLPAAAAARLLAYVRGGGTLILAGATGEFNEWREKRRANPLLPGRAEGQGRIVTIGNLAPGAQPNPQPPPSRRRNGCCRRTTRRSTALLFRRHLSRTECLTVRPTRFPSAPAPRSAGPAQVRLVAREGIQRILPSQIPGLRSDAYAAGTQFNATAQHQRKIDGIRPSNPQGLARGTSKWYLTSNGNSTSWPDAFREKLRKPPVRKKGRTEWSTCGAAVREPAVRRIRGETGLKA